MPVRDALPYLEPALASILGQSFRDFELLLYDDGSRDGSQTRLEACAACDPRVRLTRGEPRGLAPWLRQGVLEARGCFVARMDADDVAHPERLERQLAHLEAHPECVALGSEVLLVDPERRPIRRGGVPLGHAEIEAALLRGRGEALPHPTAVFRREALLRAGSYRAECATAQDLDLYLRLAEIGRLANLPDALLELRQHLGKLSTRRGGEQRRSVHAILREAWLRRGLAPREEDLPPALPDAVPAHAYFRQWAEWAIRGRELATARVHARAVLRAEPWALRSWQLYLRALAGLPAEPLRRARRALQGLWEVA
jgi:glycosyltransferase involved in cell wall biosynthesis